MMANPFSKSTRRALRLPRLLANSCEAVSPVATDARHTGHQTRINYRLVSLRNHDLWLREHASVAVTLVTPRTCSPPVLDRSLLNDPA